MKLKTFRFAPLAAVLLAAVFLHGCGYRAEAAPLASNYARADGNAGFHGGIPSR